MNSTTTTQCTIGGVVDMIGFYKNLGSTVATIDQPISMKRVGMYETCALIGVGDQLYSDDEHSYTLVDSTGCLAPTEVPTEAPTETPTETPNGTPSGISVLSQVFISRQFQHDDDHCYCRCSCGCYHCHHYCGCLMQ